MNVFKTCIYMFECLYMHVWKQHIRNDIMKIVKTISESVSMENIVLGNFNCNENHQ